jgi:hypothetical protein
MLCDRQIALVAAFDQPARTQSHNFGLQTHLTSHLRAFRTAP